MWKEVVTAQFELTHNLPGRGEQNNETLNQDGQCPAEISQLEVRSSSNSAYHAKTLAG
jgi:hypothetical protein